MDFFSVYSRKKWYILNELLFCVFRKRLFVRNPNYEQSPFRVSRRAFTDILNAVRHRQVTELTGGHSVRFLHHLESIGHVLEECGGEHTLPCTF